VRERRRRECGEVRISSGVLGAFIGAGGRAPGDGRSKAAVMAFKAIKARLRSGLKGIKGGVMGGAGR
jgi:hypothetical protein